MKTRNRAWLVAVVERGRSESPKKGGGLQIVEGECGTCSPWREVRWWLLAEDGGGWPDVVGGERLKT